MALISFKDLCIDVTDEAAMARFWSAAAGLDVTTHSDGGSILTGPTPRHAIWLNSVPEAKTVKHRVHLDVNGHSVAEYEGIGARVLPGGGSFAWTVMADPEGGEFCVFERDEPPAYRLKDIVVDAIDPAAAAMWWAGVMGGKVVHDGDYSYIEDIPGALIEGLDFVPVPEPKTVKNRIHWDVTLVGAATVDELVAKGATILPAQNEENAWTVMADPEGNEFCVFPAEN